MNYRQNHNYENLQRCIFEGVGKYDIPQLMSQQYDGHCTFIGFNYAAKTKQRHGKGIHFFIDDYQFNRLWNNPQKYMELLRQYDYVMTPDFSTYTDFPLAIQLYNHYRKHWIGAWLQIHGCQVIPTISWSDASSFEWCFDGEPEGGCVAISSVGCLQNNTCKELFLNGYKEMVKRLTPETIIFYGEIPEECKGNIVRIKSFQEKFREAKINGW